jgi:hypothetical protein
MSKYIGTRSKKYHKNRQPGALVGRKVDMNGNICIFHSINMKTAA